MGQGEVGGFQHWAQVTWLLLGLAVESPWSALGGPFLSSFAQTGLENGLLAMRAPNLGSEAGRPLTKSRDYCKLVRQWVWFESRMCTPEVEIWLRDP